MAKRTTLNRNKIFVPYGSGEVRQEYLRLTCVDSGNGCFYVSIPEHLMAVARAVAVGFKGEHEHPLRNIPVADGCVVAKDRGEAHGYWDSLMWRCGDFLRNNSKEKVIVFSSQMNVHIVRDGRYVLSCNHISFAKVNPLVGVKYEVLYRCGDSLFNNDNQCEGSAVGKIVIPYTEEREAFLKSIVTALEEAAIKINQFAEELTKDPLSIDTIASSRFLIEAPKDQQQ